MCRCPCCEHTLNPSFSGLILQKYKANYLLCPKCGFLTIENPHWLKEAYSSAITSIDIGLVSRNLELSNITVNIINSLNLETGPFLDWAGGYGLFTRLMRDRGFAFHHHDLYCENIFAQHHTFTPEQKFQLITAFEFLEHTINPFLEFESLLKKSDTILFSTLLLPKPTPVNNLDWWYFAPECGQHVSFFTKDALKSLALRFNASYFHNGNSLHIITKCPSINKPFSGSNGILTKLKALIVQKVSNNYSRPSLTDEDYRKALASLRKQQASKS